jgi:hypothetical protein
MLLPTDIDGQAGIHLERRYQFVDDSSVILEEITGGRVVADLVWLDLPQNIRDAISAIDTWTHQQALIQEGM